MAWEHIYNSMLVRPGLGWASRSAWILRMVQASVKLTTYPSFTHARNGDSQRSAWGVRDVAGRVVAGTFDHV